MLNVHWRLAILEMAEPGAGRAARSNARLIGPKKLFSGGNTRCSLKIELCDKFKSPFKTIQLVDWIEEF